MSVSKRSLRKFSIVYIKNHKLHQLLKSRVRLSSIITASGLESRPSFFEEDDTTVGLAELTISRINSLLIRSGDVLVDLVLVAKSTVRSVSPNDNKCGELKERSKRKNYHTTGILPCWLNSIPLRDYGALRSSST